MTEPIIICPSCKTEIKLTESLAAPIIESIRIEYEKKLAQKDSEFIKRESALREREESLSKAKEAIDDQVAEKVRQERTKIAAEEAKKAKLELSNDLEQKGKEIIAKLQGKMGKFGLIQGPGMNDKKTTPEAINLQEEALEVLLQLQYKKEEARQMIEKAFSRTANLQTVEEVLNEVYRQKRQKAEVR